MPGSGFINVSVFLSVIVSTLCCGFPVLAGTQQTTHLGKQTAMEITIELTRQRFLAGESMPATVSIVNRNTRAIEVPDPESNVNWQPAYTLKGPACPDGHTFSFRSAVFNDPSPSPSGVEPMTITLAPGATLSAVLPLESLAPIAKPGSYTLAASLEWKGETARSEPVSFAVESPVFRAFQLLADPLHQEPFPIQVCCLIGTQEAPRIYLAQFHEDANTGAVKMLTMEEIAASGQGAATVFGSWRNYQGIGLPAPRCGWQAGTKLGVADFRVTNPLTLTLSAPSRLVRPALMPESGELDVFALSEAGDSLSLVRFPQPKTDGDETRVVADNPGDAPSLLRLPKPSTGGGDPRVMWTHDLPGRAMQARAALGPKDNGDRRVVVLLMPREEWIAAFVADAGQGEEPPKLRSTDLTGMELLPESEPAVTILADGTIQAAVIVAERRKSGAGADSRTYYVADFIWPASQAEPGRSETHLAATLSETPQAAAAGYLVADTGKMRRDWAIVLAKGEGVVSNRSLGKYILTGSPVVPIELLVLSQFTHILTIEDGNSLRFESF